MAKDIKIIWDTNFQSGDLAFDNGDLKREEGLSTAALISIFTDQRADDDDIIDNVNDKRGWWGDLTFDNFSIGSKLWQYDRSKTNEETIVNIKKAIEDSLQWMIDDEVIAKIEVDVERQGQIGNDILACEIRLYQSDGNTIKLKFDDLWKGELNAI